MSFFIRKPFSFGPIRLNLSQHGVGVSAGVKGARVGIQPSGRAYVFGGRHGLYYRQNLTASSRAASRVIPLLLGVLVAVVLVVFFFPLAVVGAVISVLIAAVAKPKRTRSRPWG